MIAVRGTRELGRKLARWSSRTGDAVSHVSRDFLDGQEADADDVASALRSMESRLGTAGMWSREDRAALKGVLADLRARHLGANASDSPCACSMTRANPSAKQRTGMALDTNSEMPVIVVVGRAGAEPTLAQVQSQLEIVAEQELHSRTLTTAVVFDGALQNVMHAKTGGGRRVRTVVAMVRDGIPAVGHYMAASHDLARLQFVNSMVQADLKPYAILGVFMGKHWPVSPRSVYRVAHLPQRGY